MTDKMEKIYKKQINDCENTERLKLVFINILMAKNITNKQKDRLTHHYILKLQELKQEIYNRGK